MKLHFYGADQCVTGSCHCLEVNGKRILIDCGLQQGRDEIDNHELPFEPNSIDYILVTHAHIDHSGRLPLLVKQGFSGNIYCTRLTAQLLSIMLRDSAQIQENDAAYENQKGKRAGRPPVEPLYTLEDVEKTLRHIVTCEYGWELDISDGIKIRFVDAGHLLGSACVEMWLTEQGFTKKIVFSGDIGNRKQPIIRSPQPITEADYVVTESTYGDRLHNVKEKPNYADDLARVIDETLAKGGNLVIPSFAVGRTQELLYFIREIKEQGLVDADPDFQVYVDSPLAVEATEIFQENRMECFAGEALELVRDGINPISFTGLKLAITSEESREINFIDTPKVIISASGMCEAGRIRHHLKHNLWREECTILFVGYQVPGTLGNHLLGGAKEVKLFGETIEVKAKIENLAGISGHADQEHLLQWVKAFGNTPKRVFVVHGQDAVCDTFAELVTKETGVIATAPYSGDIYDLQANICIAKGSRERAVKKVKDARMVSNVFARLVAAGERLLAVIRKLEGHPNKELGKFADQINSLCDKWDQ